MNSVLQVGDLYQEKFKATADIVNLIGQASGDYNPIHFCSEAAVNVGFRDCIAHSLFCINCVTKILGNKFPGNGTIILEEQLRFLAPVYLQDVILVTLKIEKIIKKEKGIYSINITCVNQDEVFVVEGNVIVKYI